MKSWPHEEQRLRTWLREPLVQAALGGLILTTLGLAVLMWIIPA